MTREEAIKIIDCYDIGFYDLSGAKIPADKLADAFDMAISALSEESKVDNAENPKCDLISREEAKAEIRKRFPDLIDRIEINTVLNELPSVSIQPKTIANNCDLISRAMEDVIAWQPLPKPYEAKMKGGDDK